MLRLTNDYWSSGSVFLTNAFSLAADASFSSYFEFHPLPGETLTMKVQKPNPSTGAIRAIDSLNLTSAIGPRSRIHSLTMDMRASQGGEQAISLPADVELLGVSRNGEALGLRLLASAPIHNPWIVRNRLDGKCALYDEAGVPLEIAPAD